MVEPEESETKADTRTMEELLVEYHHLFGRAAQPEFNYETLMKKLALEREKSGAGE